jgi:hypothetical protein
MAGKNIASLVVLDDSKLVGIMSERINARNHFERSDVLWNPCPRGHVHPGALRAACPIRTRMHGCDGGK